MRWAIGGVLMMIGIVWFSLGAGLVQGSVLTGQTVWAVIGAILTIAGLWVLTRKRKPPAPGPPAPGPPAPGSEPDE